MSKDQRFTSAFSKIGIYDAVDDDVASTIEEYACAMYGVRHTKEVNEARFQVFRKLYAPSNCDKPLDKVKSSDPCCLPPCKEVLKP